MSLAARGGRDRSDDRRSIGSLAQFARECLSLEPRGWTRRELRDRMRAQPAFWQQFERNPRAFSWMIRALILRGEVEERDGHLFAAEETRISILARKELFELNRNDR